MSGYAEYCLWVVGRLWAFWASLGYLLWKGLALLVRGVSRLGCVCSRKVPVHPAESLATICYKSAPTHAADPAHGLRAGGHVCVHAHDGKGRGTPRLK